MAAKKYVLEKKSQVSNREAGYSYEKGAVIDADDFEKLPARHKAWFVEEAAVKATKAGKAKAAVTETEDDLNNGPEEKTD